MNNRVPSVEGVELCKVWEIKTLGLSWDEEAKRLLQAVAAQVQPIMRKRRWRVPLLREFSPRNPALLGLNVNHGQEIKLRLRRHGRDFDFYNFDFILGTMLHELTHIVHAPHDGKFYKLLDELTKECEDLMVKGITGTGQGFDRPGKRLGSCSHNPPATSLRNSALAAAEKRQRLGSLMPSGPQKLGGNLDARKSMTPAQAAAMAAERRLRDDLWCAAPDTNGDDAFEKAKDREDKASVPGDREDATSSSQSEAGGNFEAERWECGVCTLLNPPLAPICAACESPKLSSSTSSQGWICKACSTKNDKQIERCGCCDEWRFSITQFTSNS